MNVSEIVTRIEQRLAEIPLSARAASLKAGLSSDAIRNWQRRVVTDPESIGITVDALQAIARALDVDFVWLLTGGPTPGATPDPPSGRRGPGMSEEAVPFIGLPNPDPAKAGQSPIQALFAGQARHPSITHRAIMDLPGFGIAAGDLLVCDLSRLPIPGELAITVAVDTDTGTAQTMIRRYAPPYLMAGDGFRAQAVEIAIAGLDIRHPVIGSIRGA